MSIILLAARFLSFSLARSDSSSLILASIPSGESGRTVEAGSLVVPSFGRAWSGQNLFTHCCTDEGVLRPYSFAVAAMLRSDPR
ncbi:MAG: hypothetical protein DSY83_15410 [Flavobacteriia bacterium]|nr:MAG: hypothetical protein DSY83_15410 [Flavobacteriia bacterium]